MSKLTAVAIVLGLLVAGTAMAEEEEPWLRPVMGVQISDLEDGNAGALTGGGLFTIPRVARWLPDVIGLNLAVPGAQDADPAPPQNVLGLEAWWTPLRSPIMDIGLGGGLSFGNFALENTDVGGMYGLCIIFKTANEDTGLPLPSFMLTIFDHTDFQEYDFEVTARFAALMKLSL